MGGTNGLVTRERVQALRNNHFFQGLNDSEFATLGKVCQRRLFAAGEICQSEGQHSGRIHFILSGRVGALLHVPNYSLSSGEILIDALGPGEVFGWSALIKGATWPTLKVVDQTETFFLDADELLALCEINYHLGFVLMRNLATLVASRLRRSRLSTCNAILAMKGDYK